MSFTSLLYLLFLAATWIIFAASPKDRRIYVLLAASYIFYAVWSVPFLLLIQVTTSVDFFCARTISRSTNVRLRKGLLTLGILINLSVLCCFKYLNFLIDCQNSILSYFHVSSPAHHLDLILPLGISFYTFEAISYLVDVYRGSKPAPNWLQYNFYIMFFPHLVAGPIVRFNKFFPQYENGITNPSVVRIKEGLEMIVLGFAFKLIIADSAAMFSKPLFARAEAISTIEAVMAAAAFMAEAYFDFQGYTHIARGTALLFNIELPVNFRNPGNATTIAEFWQRWNITLSKWLYDYVYLPMGGGRKAVATRIVAAFLTMTIAGIWHGAGLNFVVLGMYYGSLVAVYHGWRSLTRKLPKRADQWRRTKPYKVFAWFGTHSLLLPAAVLFHGSLSSDIPILKALLPFGNCTAVAAKPANVCAVFFTVAALFACGYAQPLFIRAYRYSREVLPFWVKVHAVTVLLVVCVILEAHQTDPSFMYAQF
jgi:D-alanyl-lipoteichoic acid acyltransferase DltB (MBOAT superfamily)